jgi:hypothetical protein
MLRTDDSEPGPRQEADAAAPFLLEEDVHLVAALEQTFDHALEEPKPPCSPVNANTISGATLHVARKRRCGGSGRSQQRSTILTTQQDEVEDSTDR